MNNLNKHVSPAGLSETAKRGWTKSSNGMWHLYRVDNTIVARVYQNYKNGKWVIHGHYDTLKEAKAVAEALVAMR